MERLFTLADAAAIAVEPYVARAVQGEAVRAEAHAREAAQARGKSQHLDPFTPREDEALMAEARAACDRARAFAAGARGRFLAALRALEAEAPVRAEAARAAYARGLAHAGPAGIGEIGRALVALDGCDCRAVWPACLGVAELLAETAGLAAA